MDPAIDQALQLLQRTHNRQANLLRRAISQRLQDPRPLVDLGHLLVEAGQGDAAAASFMAGAQRDPNFAPARFGLGQLMERVGHYGDAAICYEEAVRIEPSSDHLFHLARALHLQGQLEDAGRHYQRAIEADPKHVRSMYNLAVLLAGVQQEAAALQLFETIVSIDSNHGQAWCSLGALRRQDGDLDGANQALRRAVALQPKDALSLANLADTLAVQSQLKQARTMAGRALKADPDNIIANLVQARMDREDGNLEQAAARLEGLASRDVGPLNRGRTLVELGMVKDRMKEPEVAFAASCEGQALLAKQPPAAGMDLNAFPNLVEQLTSWTPQALQTPSPPPPDDDLPTPFFLIGFPRSGTTLTEQIITSHTGLDSLDELSILDTIAARTVDLCGGQTPYPQALDSCTPEQLGQLRAQYWDEVRKARDGELPKCQLIDKLPLNLVHVALISRLFPESRLLVALRDPRDCCISAFMQYFVPNEAMIQLYDLRRTAELYQSVMTLWLNSREHLKLPYLETRYEDLVDDLEGTARRMLEFLQVDWEPSVLEYHEQAKKKHISTPSQRDVSRPIFRRSLARWRRYEEPVRELQPLLAPFVSAFGYSDG
ncbi:MAG TPA: hypothetical protein DIU15_09950 [Deltaproteobacteria bacterium]|nr:hypothetical protein [Deltaproteobacteria bacterium]HCP46355.1 hypothetical protein [Deltaproteobacteria bacterium]